jgi:CelD/BcsL family acetyltransferase involved in cellulose biosynthesis
MVSGMDQLAVTLAFGANGGALPEPAVGPEEDRSDASASRSADAVVLVEDPSALAGHTQAWDELAAEALEANPFYEPWMLLPAAEAFGKDRRFQFALVYRPHELPGKARRLVGFFPLERQRHYKGLPASTLRLWKHDHCFLCTPLLHARYAREGLEGFFEWASRSGASLVEFGQFPTESPFHRHLVDYLSGRQRLHHVFHAFNRALFRTRASAEEFLSALSPEYRKEMRRLRKRLAEVGTLEFRKLEAPGALDDWIGWFMDLEARGWKGRAGTGTAIALHENESTYCRRSWRDGLSRGKLQMAGLFLDARPIAITVNYLAGDGGFHYKIAYDEAFGRYSPGVQLELELIREAHVAPGPRWLDSCAVPDHPMINRLWPERRTMQTTLVSLGHWHGDLSVSVLPLLRWLKRLLLGAPGTDA